jgi:hypothetical protein
MPYVAETVRMFSRFFVYVNATVYKCVLYFSYFPNRAALLFVFTVVPICSYYGASQDCHTRELHEVQGITSTRTPRALSRGETNEASSWSCSAQLPIKRPLSVDRAADGTRVFLLRIAIR